MKKQTCCKVKKVNKPDIYALANFRTNVLFILILTNLCETLFINKGLTTFREEQNFIKLQNLKSNKAKQNFYSFWMYYQTIQGYLGQSSSLQYLCFFKYRQFSDSWSIC